MASWSLLGRKARKSCCGERKARKPTACRATTTCRTGPGEYSWLWTTNSCHASALMPPTLELPPDRVALTAESHPRNPVPPTYCRRVLAWFAAAVETLTRFSDPGGRSAATLRRWVELRERVSSEDLKLVGNWVEGWIGRTPGVPERFLDLKHDLLGVLWDVKEDTPGRTTARESAVTSDHLAIIGLLHLIKEVRSRLRKFAAYIGFDEQESGADEGSPAGGVHAVREADSKATDRRGPGQPRDPQRPQIMRRVEALRAKRTPWKQIPAVILEEFGREFPHSTLQKYFWEWRNRGE